MKKEFQLSEKIYGSGNHDYDRISVEDVREFLMLEEELMDKYISGDISWEVFAERRRKLLGDLK